MGWTKTQATFSSIINAMARRREYADSVASYIDELSSMNGGYRVDPLGGRIRELYAGDWTQTNRLGKSFKAELPTGDPNIKGLIPVVPLPFDKHYIASLKPLIRYGNPVPALSLNSSGPTPQEAIKQLNDIANLLTYAVSLKMKDGILPSDTKRSDRLIEEAIRKGVAGFKFVYTESGVKRDFRIDFIPRAAFYQDPSGRFIAIECEVYHTDPDADSYDLDWNDPDDPTECRTYLEIYDTEDRVTYYVGNGDGVEHGKEIKKSEEWPVGMDAPPIVLLPVGEFDPDGTYTLGHIWPWATIWEEMIIALSVIVWYAVQSHKTKKILGGQFSITEEEKEELNDPNKQFVFINAMVGDAGSAFQMADYTPINQISEWVAYWNFLNQLLVQFQFLPNISRGLESPSTGYMKAGTAEIVNQTRSNFADEFMNSMKTFWERFYKTELDFFSAYPELNILTEYKARYQEPLLTKDLYVSVDIDDIRATSKMQKQDEATKLIQVLPALTQSLQQLAMLYQSTGKAFDVYSYISDTFERLGLPPISSYEQPALVPPTAAAGAEASPASAAPSPAMGAALFSEIGRTDLYDEMNKAGLPPEMIQAVIENLARKMDSGALEAFLDGLEAALGTSDPETAIIQFLKGGTNA